MAKAARLVFHHTRSFGVLLVSVALFAAFVIGWITGNMIQLVSVIVRTEGGRNDPVRLRMAQDIQQHAKYYDDVLLHGRVT